MSNSEHEQNVEKYHELYEYSRDLHFRQIERANRIDQKSAMFLSALTVLIGFAGFFLKATIGDAIPPQSKPDWCLLVAASVSGLTVVSSWFAFLSVLRVRKLENLRLDDQTLAFFRDNRRIDIHYAISRRAAEAFSDNDVHIAAKLRRLTFGYLTALVGVLLLALSLTIFGYMKWNDTKPKPYERTYKVSLVSGEKKGEERMPDDQDNGAEAQGTDSGSQGGDQSPVDQPNADVQAPANIIQTESVDYSQITTRDAGKSESKKDE